MKCILHIGTEKTGTSSLQQFLHLNRDTIAKHGYLYTKSAGVTDDRALPVAAYNEDRRDDLTQNLNIRDSSTLAAYQDWTIKALRTEIENAKGIHTVIFSSEHIQSRLRTDDELSRLRQILNGFGFDKISVVVYLRSPVEIANSLFSTAIKSGHTWESPPEPDDEYFHNICDHRDTLMRYRSTFGLDAIVPRIYTEADLVNGSIIDDFAETIGLVWDKKIYALPYRLNKSMTVIGIEILRRINMKIPELGPDNTPNPMRGNILSHVLKNFEDGELYGMPTELRQKYAEAFEASNEWVRAEYFPNREKLFGTPNIPIYSESRFRASEFDQIACLMSDIWLQKSN